MITPLQQSAGLASTSVLRSILERKDEQRLEEEKKAKGVPSSESDEMLKAKVSSSQSHAALNDKINAHFFGGQAEADPLAKLISRFAQQLGMERVDGESDARFGQRAADRMTLIGAIGQKEAGDGEPVTLARFGVTVSELDATLDGSNAKPSATEAWLARMVTEFGISRASNESDSAYSARIGDTLRQARAPMAKDKEEIAQTLGLKDLGIEVEDLIAAMSNPRGQIAKDLSAALQKQAKEDKGLTKDLQKALQRMDDIADPKSKAELVLERDGAKDPTRVEDDDTRAERAADIRAKEASEKLDHVRKAQDALAAVNEAAIKTGHAPGGDGQTDADPGAAAGVDPAAALAGELLQTLAAHAETAKTMQTATATKATNQQEAAGEPKSNEEREAHQLELVKQAGTPDGPSEAGMQKLDAKAIFAVSVDEIGLYELLKHKTIGDAAKAA
ncbi:hypothetical protein BJF92_12635 [Rhizobium rhizosphaerae]|uniref:Uncharacterized protein n=1 Tax=Xaviernesmea rhizosphaerae TaxID=1672749 RepID=A0A1Q9AJS6_9HYPH|nr:hypothetical protein [Xaviernesmea rhizosphaerae]OLP55518.1 hypothetical protein BJF92_12635 [Xaviernesmea rhizosphaerae]